jgi:methyl coenzyme M reductase alpha subunit
LPDIRFAGKLMNVGENTDEQGAELAIHGNTGKSKIHVNNQVRKISYFEENLQFSFSLIKTQT